MTVSNSTKDYLPLEVENDSYAQITRLADPAITWHYNEAVESHDWEGFIKISTDGNYTFSAKIDDNGYIELHGEKVVELTGTQASTLVIGAPVYLAAGYHKIKLHHENGRGPLVQAGAANAEEFIPMMDGAQIQLYEIKVPTNIISEDKARSIVNGYALVDYHACEAPEDVWAKFGPKAVADMDGEDTCATRVSVALNLAGYDLSNAVYPDGSPAGNSVSTWGWDTTQLPGVNYLIFSAEVMSNFIKTNVASGADGHYTDSNIDSNLLTQDILIYGDPVHVGICTAEDTSMGSFICGDVWILYRETWNPMQ